MYLVDTNVLFSSAPSKAVQNQGLAAWMDRNSESLFISVITVAEVQSGIAKARREGATRKADALSGWFDTLLHLYSARILALDIQVARILGQLSDKARGAGHAPGFADLAIAATAAHHGCTILTRNVRHFEWAGINLYDPFENIPA